jgi:hypothetical protein
MKIRSPILSFFLGVIATALCAVFALHGNNTHWQMEAYKHYAAVWKMDAHGRMTWQWIDDYYFDELTKLFQATPTPAPEPAIMETL